MVDQRQFEDQAAPATARGHSKQSVNSATSLPTAGRARLQPRNTDIQSFADVRPVIQGWLRNYDQVFMPLEEKTGIPREMVSSGVFGFIDPQIILFFTDVLHCLRFLLHVPRSWFGCRASLQLHWLRIPGLPISDCNPDRTKRWGVFFRFNQF